MAAERVLRLAEGSAALVWCSNDTTPMVTFKMYRNVVGDLVFTKKARQSSEFVVQRMFVQAASNECAAVRRLFAHPWSIMKSGILVETFVWDWDGALHSSCDRLHRRHRAAYHTHSKPMLTSSMISAC